MEKNNPKILALDIETSPLITYTWGLFDQNIPINQVKDDWFIMSYSAKFVGEPKMFYRDQRGVKSISDDSTLVKELQKLIDSCDILLTQNGKRFDIKKINSRAAIHGLPPTAKKPHIDTLQIAKKHFAFTSNKLEYLSDKLCKKFKKQKHAKFGGFEMWRECLAGNKAAWNEMQKYNKYDVLALEELYTQLYKWDNSINFNLYRAIVGDKCSCGANPVKWGFWYTTSGKFQRYKCGSCGAESRGKDNLLSKDKRKSLNLSVR